MHGRSVRFVSLLGAMALLASCGHRKENSAVISLPPVQEAPAVAAGPGALLINRGLVPGEMLWHVRAALNVAALACPAPAYAAMTPAYNAMLKRHETALSQAYAAETERYRAGYGASWQDAFDRHQTALYNVFADPRATQALCDEALTLIGQINALESTALPGFAGGALANLEAPVATAKGAGATVLGQGSGPVPLAAAQP